ncbi:MAG TPA: inositol monophosphatase family protein [Pyrinomonadaceae bacterium]
MSQGSTTERKSLLDFAVRLAREAGEIANQYFKGSFVTERKADESLVTNADRETEEYLRTAIEQAFPDDGILGEEAVERIGTSGRRWIIDPIDGTYSFVHGVPLYAVLVSLEINRESVLGVVNLPAINELVYAARELGCFWNGEPACVSTTTSLEEALLLCTDFGDCEQHGFGAAAGDLQRRVNARRTWGDAYGHVLVATGRADIMLDPVMNVWDCAALFPIVEEAGGRFTDWRGRNTIHGGNAISTNALLFDPVMALIREGTPHDNSSGN